MSNETKVFATPLYAQGYKDLDSVDLRGLPLPKEGDVSAPAGQNNQNLNPKDTSVSEENELENRYKNLKRHHDTSIYEARNRIKELEEQARHADRPQPPRTKEEMLKFKEANPDMFAMMESVMMTNEHQVDPNRVERLEKELFESQQRTALEQIKQVHPDYTQIVDSPEFEAWKSLQSLMVKSLIDGNTTDSAAFIRCLDLYKLDNDKTTINKGSPQRSNDTSAADAVTYNSALKGEVGTGQGRIWTQEEIGKLHPEEFSRLEEEIDTAWAEGRIR